MTNVVKYLFDRDFDDLEILKEIVEQEAKEAVEEENDEAAESKAAEPPPPPSYSEEQLAQARRQAYERGKKEGIAETLAGIQQKTENTLEKILLQFETVFGIQKSFNATVEHEAAALTLTVIRKLFPALNDRHGVDEAVAVARDVLANLIREPRIAILVDEAVVDGVRQNLADFLAKHGFQGEFVVRGDSGLGAGDCRVEWMGGNAERNAGTIFAEIEAAIARHTGAALSRLEETQG
jgi:flagellar assembly protein FliH